MTFVGKLFVLVNLMFSLILAAGAFVVYSSGIDWSEPKGKLVPVKAEIGELTKQLQLADASWGAVRTELLDREDQRRGDRAFYAQQLSELFTSKDPVSV